MRRILFKTLTFWIQVVFSMSGARAGFEEFAVPQDDFSWIRTASNETRLVARFQDHRMSVRPLLLAVPSDETPEWTVESAAFRHTHGRRSATSVRDLSKISSLIRINRIWLADIPLVTVNFDRFAREIRAATFRVRIPVSADTEFQLPSADDPFVRLAESLVINPEWIRIRARLPGSGNSGKSPHPYPVTQDALRIQTEGRGILWIRGRDAAKAGFQIDQAPLSHLRLVHRGQPLPLGILAEDPAKWSEEDILCFPYEPVASHETRFNTYYLSWGESPGATLPDPEPSLAATPETDGEKKGRDWDYAEVRLEKDDPRFQLVTDGSTGTIDLFWYEFHPSSKPVSVGFDLPAPLATESAAGSPRFPAEFVFRFPNPVPATDETSVEMMLELNGTRIESLRVPVKTGRLFLEIPVDLLRFRGNRIRLSYVKGNMESFFLDSIRLWVPVQAEVRGSYYQKPELPSQFRPKADSSADVAVSRRVSDAGAWYLVLQGASDGEPVQVHTLVPSASGEIRTPSASSPLNWCIFRPETQETKAKIELVRKRLDLRTPSQADLLVVTVNRFVPVLERYLSKKENTYQIVTAQEIYDAFSHGIKSMKAIRAFCDYALRHYPRPRPRYLWLVGECRWDPRNVLGSDREDLVPSPPVETIAGISSNDQEYVFLVGEDRFPDLLVSRVSVSTPEELRNYLEKADRTRKGFRPGWWRCRDLMLSDGGFSNVHRENLEDGLLDHVVPDLVRLEDYPLDPIRNFEALGRPGKEARGARQDVVRKWSEGAGLVEYVGHGGVIVWSNRALFKGLDRPDSDVRRLRNENRYPFVLLRSCLSGSVNWPQRPGTVSVAEDLIRAKKRGAVAVLGAAGTEFQFNQERYARHVHGALWNHRLTTLGLVRAYAHCQFTLELPDSRRVADQFMLHGDPLLEIRLPEEGRLDPGRWNVRNGSPELSVKYRVPFAPGNGQLKIHRHGKILFESPITSIENPSGELTTLIPPSIAYQPDLVAAVYFWNPQLGRDAFASVSLPRFRPDEKVQIPLKPGSPGPIVSALLEVLDPPLRNGEVSRAKITFSADETAPPDLVFRLNPVIDNRSGKSQTVRLDNRKGYALIDLHPGRSGTLPFELLLDNARLSFPAWSQRLTGAVTVSGWGKIEVTGLQLDPKDPVEGEEVFLKLEVRNGGGYPLKMVKAECSAALPGGRKKKLQRVGSDLLPLPFPFGPAQEETLCWRFNTEGTFGKVDVVFSVQTDQGESWKRSFSFAVGQPPEIVVRSIEAPVSGNDSYDLADPLPLRITYENIGRIASDPMVLEAEEGYFHDRFKVVLPSLGPGRTGTVTAELKTPHSRFLWSTGMKLLPEAITGRTKWHPQKLRTQVSRSLDPASDFMSRSWSKHFETPAELGSFSPRCLELGEVGFTLLKDQVLPRDYPAGRLRIDTTSRNVFSATNAVAAALENPKCWWVSPTEIQAHPVWKGTPLKVTIPWDRPPTLAKVSPMYRKNDTFLGFRMPGFQLVQDPFRFDVHPGNTHFEWTFPEKVVTLSEPGSAWYLAKGMNLWPGFKGFRVRAMPSLESPVFHLPGNARWRTTFEVEWIPRAPKEIHLEARSTAKSEGWKPWVDLRNASVLKGDRLQVRCWFDPLTSPTELVIRSVTLTLRQE